MGTCETISACSLTPPFPARSLQGAQVLPATDVPPALEGQPGTPQTKQRAAVWHDEKSPALTRREAAGPPSPGKQAYGKWYVPPNDWSSVYQPGGPSVHKVWVFSGTNATDLRATPVQS